MKSFFGQSERQQDAEVALYWNNLEAEANRRHRLRFCWNQYINGTVQSPLFIDKIRRSQVALDWAYKPIFESGDYTRLQWLYIPGWETGVFCEHFVIVFPRIKYNSNGAAVDVLGLTLYDLDERLFGVAGLESVELDRNGKLILEGALPEAARPMNIPLKRFLIGLDYMIAHNGRSKAEVEQTRRRVAQLSQQFRNERMQILNSYN